MAVEKAVASSSVVPGTYTTVNLKGGARSPGAAALRAIVMCPLAASGASMSADTITTSVADAETVAALVGRGTPGHLFAVAFFAENKTGQLDIAAAAAGGGVTATATAALTGTITEEMTVRSTIAGRVVETNWAAGEAGSVAAARHATKLNDVKRELGLPTDHSTQASPNDHIIDIDAAAAGLYGNDILAKVELIGGAGGTVTMSPTTGYLATGTLEPDYAALRGLIDTTKYDYIAMCVSNTEAALVTAGTNPADLKTHITAMNSGLNASQQNGIYGCTGLQSAALTGADAHNFEWMECVHAHKMQSLGCEFAGAECGQRMRERALYPAKNRIKMKYRARLYGVVTDTDKLGETELSTGILGGLTEVVQSNDGSLSPARPVTTYHEDSDGNADGRVRDTTIPDGMAHVVEDLEVYVADEFSGKNVVEDQPAGSPPINNVNVVEVGDIRAAVEGRMELHIGAGVVNRASFEASVTDGTFAVEIDDTDRTQVNMVIPFKIVNVHAKTGIVAKHVA